MIRIGDFSKLTRVSVKTLRFYDEMGLLVPVEVDPLTGEEMQHIIARAYATPRALVQRAIELNGGVQ